jgi:hypothetical protein
LGATIRVHADQGKNSSNAVAGPRCINCLAKNLQALASAITDV